MTTAECALCRKVWAYPVLERLDELHRRQCSGTVWMVPSGWWLYVNPATLTASLLRKPDPVPPAVPHIPK